MFPHQVDYCPSFMGQPTGQIPFYPWGQQEYCGYEEVAPIQYATEDELMAGIRDRPFELTGHGALADFLGDQGRPQDEAFRRALMEGIRARIYAPLAQPTDELPRRWARGHGYWRAGLNDSIHSLDTGYGPKMAMGIGNPFDGPVPWFANMMAPFFEVAEDGSWPSYDVMPRPVERDSGDFAINHGDWSDGPTPADNFSPISPHQIGWWMDTVGDHARMKSRELRPPDVPADVMRDRYEGNYPGFPKRYNPWAMSRAEEWLVGLRGNDPINEMTGPGWDLAEKLFRWQHDLGKSLGIRTYPGARAEELAATENYADEYTPTRYGDPYAAESLTDLRLPPAVGVNNPTAGGVGNAGGEGSPWVARAGLPRVAGGRARLGRAGEYAAYAEYEDQMIPSGVTGYSCGHPGCDQLLQVLYSCYRG